MISAGEPASDDRVVTVLGACRFSDAAAAGRAAVALSDMLHQRLLDIDDAAIVSWSIDRKRPTTRQLHDVPRDAPLEPSFWGLLFGLLFFVPVFGIALDAATGTLGASLADVGIDDEFIDSVRSEVQPGTSALFVVSSSAALAALRDTLADDKPYMLRTTLTTEEEARLRDAFSVG